MNSHLPRLPPAAYRGRAYVHWTMTLRDRRIGWLTDAWHRTFREILTHSSFRHALCCPVYCLMPDHVHLLWMGYATRSDQKRAIIHLRRSTSQLLLNPSGFQWQRQPHDRVLRDEDRDRNVFEEAAHYILNNPARAGLVNEGNGHTYPFSGCLLPGYPALDVWHENYWEKFWKLYWQLSERDA